MNPTNCSGINNSFGERFLHQAGFIMKRQEILKRLISPGNCYLELVSYLVIKNIYIISFVMKQIICIRNFEAAFLNFSFLLCSFMLSLPQWRRTSSIQVVGCQKLLDLDFFLQETKSRDMNAKTTVFSVNASFKINLPVI